MQTERFNVFVNFKYIEINKTIYLFIFGLGGTLANIVKSISDTVNFIISFISKYSKQKVRLVFVKRGFREKVPIKEESCQV